MGVVWYVLFLRAATSENSAPGPGYEEQVVATVMIWGHAEDKRLKAHLKGGISIGNQGKLYLRHCELQTLVFIFGPGATVRS